jgi:hypothetical protein
MIGTAGPAFTITSKSSSGGETKRPLENDTGKARGGLGLSFFNYTGGRLDVSTTLSLDVWWCFLNVGESSSFIWTRKDSHNMLIPKKNRREVYKHLFKGKREGVVEMFAWAAAGREALSHRLSLSEY